MFEPEAIDNQRVAVVGIFSAIAIFVIIIAVQVLFYRLEHAEMAEKNSGRPIDAREAITAWQTELNATKWVDRGTDTVTVPIDQAMKREVEVLRQGAKIGRVEAPGSGD